MDGMLETSRLPLDVEAHPVVQAAKAIQPKLRAYKDEIERGQRMPKALVEEFHDAGFYRMTLPHAIDGHAARPDHLYARRRIPRRGLRLGRLEPRQLRHRPARDARPAAGGRRGDVPERAPDGDGRHRGARRRARRPGQGRLPRDRPLAVRHRLPGSELDARQLPDRRGRQAAPQPGRAAAVLARGVFPRRGGDRPRQLGCRGPARHRQLRLDGRPICSCPSGASCRISARRSTTSGRAGRGRPTSCPRNAGSGRITARSSPASRAPGSTR